MMNCSFKGAAPGSFPVFPDPTSTPYDPSQGSLFGGMPAGEPTLDMRMGAPPQGAPPGSPPAGMMAP